MTNAASGLPELAMALGVVLGVFVIGAASLPGWFQHKILRKAGRSPWWNVSIYLPILIVLLIAIMGPKLGSSSDAFLGVASGLLLWPIVAIWLFAFVEWPTRPTLSKRLDIGQLASGSPAADQYFQIAAKEINSDTMDLACWGRALALTGNESAAKNKYVQLRVATLVKENFACTPVARPTEPHISKPSTRTAADYARMLSVACFIALTSIFLLSKALNDSSRKNESVSSTREESRILPPRDSEPASQSSTTQSPGGAQSASSKDLEFVLIKPLPEQATILQQFTVRQILEDAPRKGFSRKEILTYLSQDAAMSQRISKLRNAGYTDIRISDVLILIEDDATISAKDYVSFEELTNHIWSTRRGQCMAEDEIAEIWIALYKSTSDRHVTGNESKFVPKQTLLTFPALNFDFEGAFRAGFSDKGIVNYLAAKDGDSAILNARRAGCNDEQILSRLRHARDTARR